MKQIVQSCVTRDVFYVPGEHDVFNDEGAQFLERFGKGSTGAGWRSFDKKGVRFIGLVNVMQQYHFHGFWHRNMSAYVKKFPERLNKSEVLAPYRHKQSPREAAASHGG